MRRATFAWLILILLASAAAGFYLTAQVMIKGRSRSTVSCSDYYECAVSAYKALVKTYYLPSFHLYSGQGLSMPFAGFWQTAQVTSAANYLSLIPNSSGFGVNFNKTLVANYEAMQLYLDPLGKGYESSPPVPPSSGGPEYYDDNAWGLLALIQGYLISHNQTYLAKARAIFNFEVGGWAGSSLPCPGGIYWEVGGSPLRSRNTCSNAPVAEAAAELYLITGNRTYLDWAQRIYGWVFKYLRAPNALYYDHITCFAYSNGSVGYRINTAFWTYNQGTMIGTGAMLYIATGNSTYLNEAKETAISSLLYFQSRLMSQPIIDNAIYFRNLVRLGEVTGNQTFNNEVYSMMKNYTGVMCANYRYSNDIFMAPGYSDIPAQNIPESEVDVMSNAAMVQIYSLLAGAKPLL
ncbi:MAG: glycoside hydrolase family 76 protein [Thermoprotei archaeon]